MFNVTNASSKSETSLSFLFRTKAYNGSQNFSLRKTTTLDLLFWKIPPRSRSIVGTMELNFLEKHDEGPDQMTKVVTLSGSVLIVHEPTTDFFTGSRSRG